MSANNGLILLKSAKQCLASNAIERMPNHLVSPVPHFLPNRLRTPSSASQHQVYNNTVAKNNLLQSLMKEAVIYLDTAWRIEGINREAERILGASESAIMDLPIFNVINIYNAEDKTQSIDSTVMSKLCKKNQIFKIHDAIMQRVSGAELPVEFIFCPIYEEGHCIAVMLVLRDISQLKRMEQTLVRMASKQTPQLSSNKLNENATREEITAFYASQFDVLTGLLNRYQFEQQLQELLNKSVEFGVEHAFIYIDLDQFKVINDTCGHMAGDELLRQISNLIKSRVRKWDVVARLGGDEFGLQLLYCTQKQAISIAENLRESIQNYRFLWQGKSFSVSASIGLVSVTIKDKDAQNIMRKADLACYTAKDQGRDRIYIFEENDHSIAERHGDISVVSQLTNALDEDCFELFCQEIKPLNADQDGEHFEILVRMIDENKKCLEPEHFLPAAERYNMISKIDRWVFRNTCAILAANRERIDKINTCTINISGQTINDDRFLDFAIETMKQHNIPFDKICFEITETGVISNIHNAKKFINEMRELGIRFALDDFGSGLSSFAYLKELPVDYVKIDGLFIKGIENDAVNYSLVKSIHELGQVMGKQTVAEFVENQGVLDKLDEIGINYVQGYAISKPQRFESFIQSMT